MKGVVKRYIENLTINDVKTYIKNKNYEVSEHDVNIIYNYIKEYCDDILDKKDGCMNKLKEQINPTTFNQLMDLYNKYKDYI